MQQKSLFYVCIKVFSLDSGVNTATNCTPPFFVLLMHKKGVCFVLTEQRGLGLKVIAQYRDE